MALKMGTKAIIKDKLDFKISNIVILKSSLIILVFPEMSVFDVGSSNFVFSKSLQHSLH